MNKTTHVHISKIPFIMEETAYYRLSQYLEKLKSRFPKQEERDEILSDIETRIAEILQTKQKGAWQVITEKDVQEVLALVGSPEEIETNEPNPAVVSTPFSKQVLGKKLFRNPDDKKMGGVISGLCLYLGIQDPVWIRILTIVLLFASFSIVFWLYILLWIAIPEAKTPSEKLQMRGDRVTLDNMEQVMRDGMTQAGKIIQEQATEWTKPNNNWLTTLGGIIQSVTRIFLKVLAFCLLLCLILCALIIGLSLFGLSFIMLPELEQLRTYISDVPGVFGSALLSLILLIFIPTLYFCYLLLRYVTGSQGSIKKATIAVVFCLITGLICMRFASGVMKKAFREKYREKTTLSMMQPGGNTLYLMMNDTADAEVVIFSNGQREADDESGVTVNWPDWDKVNALPAGEIAVEVIPVSGDSFTLERFTSSRGTSEQDAKKNASGLMYSYTQSDSLLLLNEFFLLDKSGKWRKQEIRVVVGIPEGKRVCLAKNIDLIELSIAQSPNSSGEWGGTCWVNKNGSLIRDMSNTSLLPVEKETEK